MCRDTNIRWVHGGAASGPGPKPFHYRLPGYETDELTNLLIGYVRDRAEERKSGAAKPFFAVMSVQPPHDPYVAPERFMANYNPQRLILRPDVAHVPKMEEQVRRDLAGYYAMIENLDWNYGRVIEALEQTGLLADTHILFFADHGDMHGSHGMLRKICPFEESIRTPFIISGGVPRYPPWKNGRLPVLSNHGISRRPRSACAAFGNRNGWRARSSRTIASATRRPSRIRIQPTCNSWSQPDNSTRPILPIGD